jgi:hypothetical protein
MNKIILKEIPGLLDDMPITLEMLTKMGFSDEGCPDGYIGINGVFLLIKPNSDFDYYRCFCYDSGIRLFHKVVTAGQLKFLINKRNGQ